MSDFPSAVLSMLSG